MQNCKEGETRTKRSEYKLLSLSVKVMVKGVGYLVDMEANVEVGDIDMLVVVVAADIKL